MSQDENYNIKEGNSPLVESYAAKEDDCVMTGQLRLQTTCLIITENSVQCLSVLKLCKLSYTHTHTSFTFMVHS